MTGILLGIAVLKEFYGIVAKGIVTYISNTENKLELFLICISCAFIYVEIFNIQVIETKDLNAENTDNQLHLTALNFAAWMVLLVWVDFTLYLGRIEIVGQYIFMSLAVFKTMVFCLFTFVPIFLAFTFGFFILLESNVLTSSYTQVGVRTFGMMVGELTYDYIFDYDKVKETGGRNGSAQVMYIFFVISVSMIVLNLLIGLTVSKVDDLKNESLLIQTKRKINDVVALKSYYDLKRKIIENIPILEKIIRKDETILEKCRKQNCLKVMKNV